MAKIFGTLNELWNYCSFCPICQKDSRDILVSVGPEPVFSLVFGEKVGDTLEIMCHYRKKRNVYTVDYKINCLDNSFDVSVPTVQMIDAAQEIPVGKVKEAYFYFYIQSSCPKCEHAWTYSTDLELDTLDNKISNIGLERETFFLLKEANKYHVSLLYYENVMLVSRCYFDEFNSGIEEHNKVELPMVDLDLSDQAKVVNKIKTFILFS